MTHTPRRSRQRDAILKILQETDTHPTAEWIYDSLKESFPRLSLGTVYRNLSLLIDQGLVRKNTFGGTVDRFDGKTAPHYHVVCHSCGSTEDLILPVHSRINDQAAAATGYQINRHSIEFFGLCGKCQKQQSPQTSKGERACPASKVRKRKKMF